MWKYIIGKGWVPGVPARDLTDAEAKQYRVEDSGVYERVPDRPKADKGKEETKI